MIDTPDGPGLTEADMGILIGVPAQAVHDCIAAQHRAGEDGTENVHLPAEWWQTLATRMEIYTRATGRDDMEGCVTFWREQQGIEE